MSADNDAADGLDPNLLTPEEIAAIRDGAGDPAEQEALQRIAAGAGDDGDDDEEEDDGDDGAAAAPAAAPAVDAGAAAAPAASPAPSPAAAPAPAAAAEQVEQGAVQQPAPAPAPAPRYNADLPADYDTKKANLDTQLGELRTKFRSGELDVDAYEEQRGKLDEQLDALKIARTKAEIAEDFNKQTAEQQWQTAINAHFERAAKADGGGIDYRRDQEKAGDLDMFVRRLANDPAHADKSQDWFLTEAHRRVLALHGITAAASPAPAPSPAPAAATAPAADPAERRKPPLGAVAATLAQVPGADGPGDVQDEFAELDALDGEALEAAIARMPADRRERYTRLGR